MRGGDSNGWWDPSNLTVSGDLHFNGHYDSSVHRYSTAGVSFGGMDQTYGMYLVRLKGDYEPGVAISDIALLWPAGNVWPPEIDFFEDSGGTRTLLSACGCRECNSVVHAAISYSWRRPPSRSRRRTALRSTTPDPRGTSRVGAR